MGDGGPAVPVLGLVLLAAIAISAALIVVLRPALVRYALARPNARSSHRKPTPQGGGIAVVVAALSGLWIGVALSDPTAGAQLTVLTLATLTLALVGAIDDIRGLGAALRLILQALAVGAVLATLPTGVTVLPQLPRAVELGVLLLGGVWFVNLVNFMDGIDWMTVAEVVPVTAAVALLGLIGAAPATAVLVALGLLGGMVGFAPFNRPVARLFLGDVGSLPIGLLLGWVLVNLGSRGHLAAALLLPLYYLADATITLGRRLLRGERVWEAHRTHFYQRALDGGFTVSEVVVRVLVLNIALACLALVSAIEPDWRVDLATLALGGALVAWLLVTFTRGKP